MQAVVDNLNTIISDITMVVVTTGVFMFPKISDTDFNTASNEREGAALCAVIIGANATMLLIVRFLFNVKATVSSIANACKSRKPDKKNKIKPKPRVNESHHNSRIALHHLPDTRIEESKTPTTQNDMGNIIQRPAQLQKHSNP